MITLAVVVASVHGSAVDVGRSGDDEGGVAAVGHRRCLYVPYVLSRQSKRKKTKCQKMKLIPGTWMMRRTKEGASEERSMIGRAARSNTRP